MKPLPASKPLMRRAVLAIWLAATSAAATSPVQAPPALKGECGWVHGRFAVYNGSSTQRIWIAGAKRMVAIPDDFPDIPTIIRDYEAAGPFVRLDDALFADFRVCALQDSRPGRMQQVRVEAVRNATFRGRPFPARKGR